MIVQETIIFFSWVAMQIVVGVNLVFPAFLLIKSYINRRICFKKPSASVDIAVIITAYQQIDLLEAAVGSVLQSNYDVYHIYVVADNCDLSSLVISNPRVSLLAPEDTLANNVRSHFYAIDRFIRKHDVITIIDSDNLVDSQYLSQLNLFFSNGFFAVQGKRLPKNLDTSLARLDGARDVYYDFYDGKTLFEAGSSSTLSGSGMAFSLDVYKECLQSIDISGAGFDKVLQTQLLRRGYRIAYAPNAMVYDQKSSRSHQFVQQRSRWMNTWFKYMHLGFGLIYLGVRARNWNQLLFGAVLLRPPLVIFLLLSVGCMFINLFLEWNWSAFAWILACFVFISCFLIAFKDQKNKKIFFRAFVFIPRFVFLQLKSLMYIRSANKRSVATIHFIKSTDHV